MSAIPHAKAHVCSGLMMRRARVPRLGVHRSWPRARAERSPAAPGDPEMVTGSSADIADGRGKGTAQPGPTSRPGSLRSPRADSQVMIQAPADRHALAINALRLTGH